MLECARDLREEAPAVAHLLSHAAAMDSLALLGSTECIRGILCPRCHLISDAAFADKLSKSTPASVCGGCGVVFDIAGKAPVSLKKRKAGVLGECVDPTAGAPQTIKRVRDSSWMAEAAAAAEAEAAADVAMKTARAAAARQAERGPANRDSMSLADIIAAAAPERPVGISTSTMSVSMAALTAPATAYSAGADVPPVGATVSRPQALLLDSKKQHRKEAAGIAASAVTGVNLDPPSSASAGSPGLQPKSLLKAAKPGGSVSGKPAVASASAAAASTGGLLGSGLLSLLGGSTAMPTGTGIGAGAAGGFGGFGVGAASGKAGINVGGGGASGVKGKHGGSGGGSGGGGSFSFRPLSGKR